MAATEVYAVLDGDKDDSCFVYTVNDPSERWEALISRSDMVARLSEALSA
jgi:hypothetical protein